MRFFRINSPERSLEQIKKQTYTFKSFAVSILIKIDTMIHSGISLLK